MQNIISLIFRYFLSLFPACAGVIPRIGISRGALSTFPRMCGGDPGVKGAGPHLHHFSPHVRG